jgi:hypothetical protein
MNRVVINHGSGPFGPRIMKFTLTYDGELRANGRPTHKSAIREQLSPQLEELWRIHPVLIEINQARYVPTEKGYLVSTIHHSVEPKAMPRPPVGHIDLCERISRGPWNFLPLVRDSLALQCGLHITFLRKEPPGKVYQGGDIDNRLKTFLDALSVPNADQIPSGTPSFDPTYCLLEDDSLISGLHVESERLLTRPDSSKHEVRLIVNVDVRVVRARIYNQLFLGE